MQHALCEVNAVPAKPQRFTQAHTGEKYNGIQLFVFVAFTGFQKIADFLCGKGLYFVLVCPWRLAGVARICVQIAQLYGLLQRFVQNAVQISYALGTQTRFRISVARSLFGIVHALNHGRGKLG